MKKYSGFIVGFIISIICRNAIAAEASTLQQAWTTAYENNPSLEAQRAKLRASDEDVAQALLI